MIQPEELKAYPIFACLTDAQRQRIAQNAAELYVEKGEWLIREGEVPWFFVLLEGALDVEKEFGGSSEVRGRYQPGDFYGETPILLDSPTIASLRAHEASRVLRLDRTLFKELIDCSMECSNLIVQVMTKRVTAIREYAQENSPMRVLVVGSPHDTECRDVRTFLSMNRMPYEWLDRERDPERVEAAMPTSCADALAPRSVSAGSFAVIDKSVCVHDPLTVRKVADALGIRTYPKRTGYDVVIVGAGPAGLAAGVYGASEGLSVLLVEKTAAGGQAGTSSRIENYLGFPNGISGDELSSRALRQASRFGAEMVVTRKVVNIASLNGGYCIELDEGLRVQARAAILSTGVEWRRLEAEGIERLMGKGVLYGAARTEAPTVIGKDIFIVGGGNSAGQAAMFFASYAESVTMLVRGNGLASSMSQYLIDQLTSRRNIRIEANTRVVSVDGSDALETLCTSTTGQDVQRREADALFVMIGACARTEWLPKDLARDEDGYILTGQDIAKQKLSSFNGNRAPFALETNVPGLFAAGDVRHASIKRVSSGVGEGSMAIAFIHQYLALQEQSLIEMNHN